jgi:hypothetical protein
MININKYSMGATAAIITSMGLIAGLTQGADAKISIVTGLLIIAVADNISDSFSIHIYKEGEGASHKEVRSSTMGNFLIRFILALTFVGIILLFSPLTALIIASVWGLFLLAGLSYLIAKGRETHPLFMVSRHLLIALLVIAGSKFLGFLILQVGTNL